jgi:hypothetical protein
MLVTYVDNALDATSFELAAVQLFNGCSQVCGSLKLDKTKELSVSNCST